MHRTRWLLLIALLPLLLNCAGRRWDPYVVHDPLVVKEKVEPVTFDVPITVNDQTAKWVNYFQTRGRKHFARYLKRSSRYVPLMREILASHGLPKDLVYLALIESGFSAKAYSRAHAVGFWQFIRSTGRRYGLRQTTYVEERRDFEKATHAAANYLKDLYQEFGDWYIALASYNAGEGKLRKAIRRYGTRDFWRLAQFHYLKSETKNYVPKFIAATIIAKDPEKFGFMGIDYDEPLEYEAVEIRGRPIDLRVAAKLAQTDYETLQTLNPELKSWFTPPDRSSYALRIPAKSAVHFRVEHELLASHLTMGDKEYTVRPGDSMSSVAERHKVPVTLLAMANGLKTKSSLAAGQTLGIPHRPPKGMTNFFRDDPSGLQKYRVRSGDSLWKIARRFNVRLSDLKRWNKGRIGRYLKPGQTLYVKAPAGRSFSGGSGARSTDGQTYVVRSGDTLGTIAQRHGVSVSRLRQWNSLGKHIYPGQRLAIKSPGTSPTRSTAAAPTTYSKSGSTTYRVRPGDSLWEIAQRHGVSVRDLRAWNSHIGRYLKPGQRLTIRPGGARSTAPRTTEPDVQRAAVPLNTQAIYHTIASGDTLWDIARKYGVSTSDIKRWNDVTQVKRLRPGDKLKIYVKQNSAQEV